MVRHGSVHFQSVQRLDSRCGCASGVCIGVLAPIGWRISAIAACIFAVSQRHREAVMWYAALPELMVFFFVLLSLLCWVRWLQSPRGSEAAYICTMAAYI